MSVSEGAVAAFREVHNRLGSREDIVQGFVESGTSGFDDEVGPHRTAGQHKSRHDCGTRNTTLNYCLFHGLQ